MLLLLAVFVAGYVAILFERRIGIDRTAGALLLAGLLWVLAFAISGSPGATSNQLVRNLAEVVNLLAYLFGAMAIVEFLDARGAFDGVARLLARAGPRRRLVLLSLVAFVLSAFLDNLTTTVVMLAVAKRLAGAGDDLRITGGMIVIAANAGGAFSPIGDVTSTLLWVGGRVSAAGLAGALIVPSLVSLGAPLLLAAAGRPRTGSPVGSVAAGGSPLLLAAGLALVALVPVVNAVTALPPSFVMVGALGLLWAAVGFRDRRNPDASRLSLLGALRRVDYRALLFFAGLLLAVGALATTDLFPRLASLLVRAPGGPLAADVAAGVASSFIDNVPLVASLMHLFGAHAFPRDDAVMHFASLCAGTGGSLLLFGSAAGVVAARLEGLTYGWYLRRIAPLALVGFAAGAAVYLAMGAP